MLCLIAVPTFGKVSPAWAQRFFYMEKPLGHVCPEIFDGSPLNIAEKRNNAIRKAIELGAKTVLFIGDDVHVPQETLLQMLKHWRNGHKAVTGVYWTKQALPQPYIWKGYLDGPFYDWKAGDFFPIDWAGCDCLLLDVEMLKSIPEPWFSLEYDMSFDGSGGWQCCPTEDLYFYAKLKDACIQLMCDAAIQCLHEDRTTGMLYGLCDGMPQKSRDYEAKMQGKVIADIGCGNSVYPDYQGNTVVRFDANPACNPDHICDVRQLSVVDERFDLAHAAHVLEHLPIGDVGPTLKEWLRVVKIGGQLVVKVPNLQYAAKKLIEDELYTMDARWPHPYELLMVYGSQDGPGMYHQSGFTPNLLKRIVETHIGKLCTFTVEGSELTESGEATELTLIATKTLGKEKPKCVAKSFQETEQSHEVPV